MYVLCQSAGFGEAEWQLCPRPCRSHHLPSSILRIPNTTTRFGALHATHTFLDGQAAKIRKSGEFEDGFLEYSAWKLERLFCQFLTLRNGYPRHCAIVTPDPATSKCAKETKSILCSLTANRIVTSLDRTRR